MRRMTEFLIDNAADLLMGLSGFLLLYLLARLLKASPLLACCCGAAPFVVLYLMQRPALPAQFLASLS